jgi:hypothetical protein
MRGSMKLADRFLVESLKARIRPEVAAAGRRVVAREREVLDYLAAYDRGQITPLPAEPQPDSAEPRRKSAAG